LKFNEGAEIVSQVEDKPVRGSDESTRDKRVLPVIPVISRKRKESEDNLLPIEEKLNSKKLKRTEATVAPKKQNKGRKAK